MYLGLGGIISFLEKQDPMHYLPLGWHNPHSYRGYYEDLAFEPKWNMDVGELLGITKSALGQTYEGYKGGDFVMNEHTTCWISYKSVSGGQQIGHVLLWYMMQYTQ